MTMLSDDGSITDLSPLRYVRSISSPLSPLQARFKKRFAVHVLNGYGQTEIGGGSDRMEHDGFQAVRR
jgi:acyl-coenzyme A synthetase/AMP-(fatty) acid ligase